jgi:hypothetical protein
MKAIVTTKYGRPDFLHLEAVKKPGAGELTKVGRHFYD